MDSPTGTEKISARPAIHSPALAILLLSLSPVCVFLPAPCPALEDTKKEARKETPTFGLTGGQILIGKLGEKDISITTSYGKLSVPFSEVLRVRFAPRLSGEDRETMDRALERLHGKDPEAMDDLRTLGPGCYGSLVSLRGIEKDKSIRKQLSELIADLESMDDIYLDDRDEVTTGRFTIRGTIEAAIFHISRGALKLEIPSTDLVYIAWGELDTSKTWKVTFSHIESANRHLSTGYKLRKGQKFSLEASGNIIWQGRTFGPAGLANHTWNNRKMGCLQWRVGKQAWQLAGPRFNGRSPASGELQLAIHLTPTGSTSGFFRVKLRSKKK